MDAAKVPLNFLWLRSIGRFWILPMEVVGRCCFAAAFLVPLILYLLGFRGWLLISGLTLLSLSFLIGIAQHLLLYRMIRCPRCGYNPTRYKNGKNLPTNTAWKRLSEMSDCPACRSAASSAP